MSAGSPIAGDDEAVHLDAVDGTPRGSPRSSADSRDGFREIAFELLPRVDPEDGALAARVGRLEHGGEADRLERRVDVVRGAKCAYAGCGSRRLGECVPHRALVRDEMSRLRADPREPELLRDGCDDGYGAVGGDREHAVDAVAPRDLDHVVDVGEVDDLGDVGRRESRCLRVAVDAATRSPRARACSIARRWWRPAPTKSTVFTAADGKR